MVNPSEEIYKKKFMVSALLTLIYCFLTQFTSYPILLMLILTTLSLGYMIGKHQIHSYPLGVFLMSSMFLILILVATYLGIYKEMMVILAFFGFSIVGAAIMLPTEEDWGYIDGWEKVQK